MTYDSTQDTKDHINRVQDLLLLIVENLNYRLSMHDGTKLLSPEKELFDEWSPKLAELEYGSDKYREALNGLGPALQHHYSHSRHHPEHFEQGVYDMSLMDLLEMLADWKAAGERHNTGSMAKSMGVNQERFGIDHTLYSILDNTLKELGWY